MPCSFCGNPQHYVRNCDSARINGLTANMRLVYINLSLNPNTTGNLQNLFINTLCVQYNAHHLKAVAVRYTNVKTSVRKHIHAFAIWAYFNDVMPSATILPQFPDIVPAYAADLEQLEELILPWEIDRTADYSLFSELTPINLAPLFQEALTLTLEEIQTEPAVQTIKKYYINPVLLCNETDEELEETIECAICYNDFKLNETVTLNCSHLFCYGCIYNSLQIQQKAHPCCALCRTNITTFVVKNEEQLEYVSRHCRL